MVSHNAPRAIISKLILAIATTTMVVGIGSGQEAIPASADSAPTLLKGIRLHSSLSPEDRRYLENALELLQDRLPGWFQYVEESLPFALSVDTREGDRGLEAITACCDPSGIEAITFGHHFGYSLRSTTAEGQQAVFIGTLIHELTHVRDQRAGLVPAKTDYRSCVAAEKPALEKQLDVKRDLSQVILTPAYQQALNQQVEREASAFKSRKLWYIYCGEFDR